MKRDSYQSASVTAALLHAGRRRMFERIRAGDMLSLDEAAALMAVNVSMVVSWASCGKCVGLVLDGTIKVPSWQFDPAIWPAIKSTAAALGATDGWQLLGFLETSTPALDRLTPRSALEQGVHVSRVLDVAFAEAHR